MRNFKVRKVIKALRAVGCVPVRTRGSHQSWRTPGGAGLVIVVNHLGASVSRTVLSSVRRVLRAEGLTLDNGSGTEGGQR